ncbi:hypothetical protein [Salipiger abyssi]|uniref:Uncharacterized protein n=1 Tax=Salipiger abyssi TaxID=1250539 RepID=A0A1P8UXC5_9RHOB|nr:hypothetical protein [Salipiger abyssi]APZ54048.1 hypothetical protein Ga0080574_TMP3714 [Salipiger abyssi]
MVRKSSLRIGLSLICGVCATVVLAAEPEPVEQHNSNALWFENWTGLSNAKLTISAPDGEIIAIEADGGTPVYRLSGEVSDGVYRYELSAATDEQVKIVNPINNGRGADQRDTVAKPFYMEGSFTVARGVIITPELVLEDEG